MHQRSSRRLNSLMPLVLLMGIIGSHLDLTSERQGHQAKKRPHRSPTELVLRALPKHYAVTRDLSCSRQAALQAWSSITKPLAFRLARRTLAGHLLTSQEFAFAAAT